MPTRSTGIFVRDRDEFAEVRGMTGTEADELMRPCGMSGAVREHLAKLAAPVIR